MAIRTSEAVWEGNLREGKGRVKLGGGVFEGSYSFQSRFEEGPGTNPEEFIAAAHASCFSMALSADLARAGYRPERVQTTAHVHINKVDGGFKITRIHLNSQAKVSGVDEEAFSEIAEGAKKGCPVSQALASVEITLDAKLVK